MAGMSARFSPCFQASASLAPMSGRGLKPGLQAGGSHSQSGQGRLKNSHVGPGMVSVGWGSKACPTGVWGMDSGCGARLGGRQSYMPICCPQSAQSLPQSGCE